MIARLTGNVTKNLTNPLIVDVNGVGYAVFVPVKNLHDTDSPTTFHIHTHVREDALQLFGFSTQNELQLFELLITVSGVGPKTALLIMDKGADAISEAITAGDVDFFTAIPRLGKKNAQKIIIELKNKLGGLVDLDLSTDSSISELFDALLSMGFDKKEIKQIIPNIPAGATMEEKIKFALKHLGK